MEPPGLALKPQTSAYTVGCCLVQDPERWRLVFPQSSGGGKEGTESEGVT